MMYPELSIGQPSIIQGTNNLQLSKSLSKVKLNRNFQRLVLFRPELLESNLSFIALVESIINRSNTRGK